MLEVFGQLPTRSMGALLLLALALPLNAHAVELTFDPSQDVYQAGDTFVVPIRLDPEGSCVNAVSIEVAFDASVVRVADVARGSSILSLWSEEPAVDQAAGRVHFSGGIPGGYCGRVAGDPGLTNQLAGLVITAVAQDGSTVATPTPTMLAFDDEVAVLAHDGRATPLPATLREAVITIVPATTTPRNEWLETVRSDNNAPALFSIQLVQEQGIGSGKYAIIFHTTDKQSGIDHYEVLETDPDRFGLLSWIGREAHWTPAESPYVLRDQKLSSRIMVKAVDKAGNERVVTYEPPQSLLSRVGELYPFAVIIIIALVGLLLVQWMRRRSISYEAAASREHAPRDAEDASPSHSDYDDESE